MPGTKDSYLIFLTLSHPKLTHTRVFGSHFPTLLRGIAKLFMTLGIIFQVILEPLNCFFLQKITFSRCFYSLANSHPLYAASHLSMGGFQFTLEKLFDVWTISLGWFPHILGWLREFCDPWQSSIHPWKFLLFFVSFWRGDLVFTSKDF